MTSFSRSGERAALEKLSTADIDQRAATLFHASLP